MSRVPMGKVLLPNVIRHTDAHNKIQEESEMWKLRGMEKGPFTSHRSMPQALNPSRSHMHCDRVEDGSVDRLGDWLREREHDSSQDKREARYWTKKLDFEANDSDRWGHRGFKELYPEEFKSDWDRDRGDDQNGHWRKKTSRLKTAKSKHLKKSSKKKKEEKRRIGESDGESSSDKSDSVKQEQKRKSSKSKHKRKKREREEESSSEEDEEMIDGLPQRLRTRVTQEEEETLESRRGQIGGQF
ncbi:uncharacterized protein NKAPD1 isoform X1 [Oncorhynchus tshawytscha]|uniref:Uncharacterized protein n=1 Tax=Oncorhynchus tshawytscha TaxID=74940 RepID=A0A8C8MF30_ONCTS|nr:uncharacterized protein NKAPD1 isoform X1 [Oncorhynchus tshawytscha]XP_042152151.1 uncharacterized protein NKAPD1 isoform X1 [Oncorhynchus tshawytscha]XP_042152152.1 uncharacterized protein NKAPD1 isoform X1 [Oncorhynchus tshawytscha]